MGWLSQAVDSPRRPSELVKCGRRDGLTGAATSRSGPGSASNREGLLTPKRSSVAGARIYTPADVRDARIVHQFRLAGHRIPALRALMPVLRQSPRNDDITAALHAREASITVRSRAPLRAASALEALIIGRD